jgi:hypothetical protein
MFMRSFLSPKIHAFIIFAVLQCSCTDAFCPLLSRNSIDSGFPASSVVSTLSLKSASSTTSASVGAASTDISDQSVASASVLKSVRLTNANGERITLGDEMAIDRPSIVIFLRHLACPYCWSYAKEWSNLQGEIEKSNISGPFFVSIGDKEKLNKFLELNPYMERNKVFVDDYTEFSAYKALGFGRFDEAEKEVAKQVQLSAPSIGGFREWWNYFINFNALSPVPKGLKFGQIPEGVLRLGGTFVISGDEIIYRWDDRLPGDHPDVKQILKIAQERAIAS